MQRIYEAISCNWKNIIIRGTFSLTIPLISLIYTKLNHCRGIEKILCTFIDEAIPFCKFFSVPYMLWYAYVGIFLGLLCIMDKKNYIRLLIGLNVGMLLCYLIYYLFPTFVPRPSVIGSDIFSNMVRFIYEADNPYNCFPSIHVLNSLLVALYVNRSIKLNNTIKLISSICSLTIILSTMVLKQHYILDVMASTTLAYFLYFVIGKLSVNLK
ncbi:phosphatase PAP2 family protein [Haloimpatiens sp. FM7315]|uniref:phosphatase PAP2 family protein n=1 Tax=Haloimpatiens sp. FM7315 TaxID=3298609 RepID=UPI00370AFB87